jgi:putative flippase GtrA
MNSVPRMCRRTLRRPLARFLCIGVASTAAYALLLLVLLGPLGSSAANFAALALTAVANTVANRRLTFGVRGREGRARQYAASLVVFLIALAITDGALALLNTYDSRHSRPLEEAVLVGATLVATVCRFVALRTWVFTTARTPATVNSGA